MKQTREKIYRGLKTHRGSLKTLAGLCKVTPDYIRLVLDGTQRDEEVMLEAAKLWKKLETARTERFRQTEQFAEEAEQLSAQLA